MGLKKALRRHLRSFGWLKDVEAIKIAQARRYFDLFEGTVAYGPFTGFKLQRGQYWNHYDVGAKLFGLYEQQITERIVSLSRDIDIFIDIGAADGYFGVAAVSQGYFGKSYCFEIEPEGRRSIARAAELNGVADKVEILGAADASELERLLTGQPGPAVVLVDIEGAEFDFLTDSVIETLAGCHVIIELHDWLVEDGAAQRSHLLSRLERRFRHKIVTMGQRDLTGMTELEHLPDSERWLICDEGRGRSMEWLFLEPHSTS